MYKISIAMAFFTVALSTSVSAIPGEEDLSKKPSNTHRSRVQEYMPKKPKKQKKGGALIQGMYNGLRVSFPTSWMPR